MRCAPSKWKGLVTTPTVRMPCSRTARAITGAAPVPVPPPMPAVMNTMWLPESWSRISSSASSAAARPTSGRAPAPSPWVMVLPSWTLRSVSQAASACASVLQDDELDPLEMRGDHVVHGIAAGAADADDRDLRLQLVRDGQTRLMVICYSSTEWPTVFGSGHDADRGQVAGRPILKRLRNSL